MAGKKWFCWCCFFVRAFKQVIIVFALINPLGSTTFVQIQYMRKMAGPIVVTLVMLMGILGITNPGFRQPYQLFENTEGKVVHNYFFFSVYRQYNGFEVSKDGRYIIYKRYVGIALNFFEISPVKQLRE